MHIVLVIVPYFVYFVCICYREERGEHIYEALGHMVYKVASVSPKGLLMFFPSNKVKETCLKRWGSVYVEDDQKNIISLYDAIYSRKVNT